MVWLEGLPEQNKGRVELVTLIAQDLNLIDKELETLGPNIAVIPLNSLLGKDGSYMPFEDFVEYLAGKRDFPVYALWDIALGKGVVGGKMVSGELQGRKAAELALSIVRGTPVDAVPVVMESPNQYMFDWDSLQYFNIDSDVLPAYSSIINRPVSFYAENKTLVQATLVGIAILIVLILALVATVARLKRAKDNLLLSDEILKQMPDAMVLTDLNGNIERWLGKAEHLFGYSETESLGQPVDCIGSSANEFDLNSQVLEIVETTGGQSRELVCQSKENVDIPIELTAQKILVDGGESVGIIVILKDITERKEAERALKESEAQFKKMIAKSPLPMVITDDKQDVTFFNEKFTELFGYTLDDFSTAEEWWRIAYPDQDYREKVQESWVKAIEIADFNDNDIAMQEWDLTIKDRSTRRCEFYMVPLEGQSLVIMNDITERVQAEAEKKELGLRLQQAQKMESIGTLAGGIAHDFNNILSAIIGFTELSMESHPADTQLLEDLNEVYVAGLRAKDLVKQILTFSRKRENEISPLHVGTYIKETLKFLRSSLPPTIEIIADVNESISLVLADPIQIHQMVMNICTNANHSMEDEGGGTLTVKVSEVTPDHHVYGGYPSFTPGKYIELSFKDTGIGISPENIDSIFDPYFTTKSLGDGTGLGLATTYGIVQDLGGIITVESELGKGSLFTILLPVLSEAVGEEGDHQKSDFSFLGGSEHILVVDDELPLLRLVSRMLERKGYTVTAKDNGQAALDQLKESPDFFDLVISDISMPHLTGDVLASHVFTIRPDLPILLVSGFNKTVHAVSVGKDGIKGLLQKPVVEQDLLSAVRRVLDNK